MFEVILRIFLSFLSHVYKDIVGGASFLKKILFQKYLVSELFYSSKMKKPRFIFLIMFVCGWNHGRVSILYKNNSTERKQLNLSAKIDNFFQNAVILQIFIVRGPL